MEKEIKDHYLHPSCPLVLDSTGEPFVCSACKLRGSGMYRYRCSGACNFYLHGQCATCPEKLSFWGHPQHELVLERARADLGKTLLELRPDIHGMIMSTTPKGGVNPIGCEMCTGEIEGTHYHCRPCGFFAHAVCVMMPMLMSSTAHEEHDLALLCSFPTMCAACQMPAAWAYRCVPCLAFYHLNCLPENAGVFAKPFSDRPTNPFFVPPPMMGPHGAGGLFSEANPFGIAHTYGHRGL